MEIITLNTATSESKIFVNIPFTDFKKDEILRSAQNDIVIITDSNVITIYGKQFSEFKIIELIPGEKSKSLSVVENIYKQLLDYKLDRQAVLIGIGGGVVCDITGFVASTYLRGIRFGFVASTLLAQVDAAIGGKNGVDFLGYKNIIGTFNLPEFVICDSKMLDTLPDKEYRCGLAEIIKTSLIWNRDLFEFIERNSDSINKKDMNIINNIISGATKIKVSIVEQDERDKGIRKILNFGHTIAHALEQKTAISHGEAVSIGILKSSEISLKLGLLSEIDFNRIKELLFRLQLLIEIDFGFEELLPVMFVDKKRDNNIINYVLLKSIGEAYIHQFNSYELKNLL